MIGYLQNALYLTEGVCYSSLCMKAFMCLIDEKSDVERNIGLLCIQKKWFIKYTKKENIFDKL